jgi:hypothetical protein
MKSEGVFNGQVNVLHPWEVIPKSKHVQKETGVYFTLLPSPIHFVHCLSLPYIFTPSSLLTSYSLASIILIS